MPARIMIVDDIATNRIVLNVKLVAARYDVDAVADPDEARRILAERPPDLILLAADFGDKAAVRFCLAVKSGAATADIPVVMVGEFSDPERRLTALRAGADDVLARPLHDQMLLARIRSLLRARHAATELRLRDGTDKALGLAEPAAGFARCGQIAVVRHTLRPGTARADSLGDLTGHLCREHTFEDLLDQSAQPSRAPLDVILLDGTTLPASQVATILPRFAAELRSRSDTRTVSQIALLPADAEDLAAILLDIGVDDVVEAPVTDGELSLRLDAALRRKYQSDRLRETVRDGLRAAVTDPLTGLYNRRYVQPHLVRMAEAARRAGTDFAMMVLDIDHFKAINDSYGHAVGDRVLIGVARRLTACLRGEDLVARIGGEEFMVAMPDATVAEAQVAAERLREAISGRPFDIGPAGKPITVTMSIGVAMAAQLCAGDTFGGIDALFDRADAALYRAKTSGRNMVNVARTAA